MDRLDHCGVFFRQSGEDYDGTKAAGPLSEVYRGFAEKEEAFAAEATLTNVKELHERSALKWRQLSEQAHRPAGQRK